MYGPLDRSKASSEIENKVDSEENYDLPLRDRIIDHIARKSDVVVKSQQRNEPDLNFDERKTITTNLLDGSPSQFLFRFGKHLKREHLLYFNSFSNNVEMKFYLQEAQKQLNDSTRRLRIRNRRFGALKKMETTGSSYFKEDEMRKRDPLLYEELVDRNLTEEERSQRHHESGNTPVNTFSDLLFEQIERNYVNEKRKRQERANEDCMEEEDDDTDEEEDEEEVDETEGNEIIQDEGEKSLMREEFRTTICAQFVSGRDKEFDYSKIDEEEENDLLDWESQDLEEKYFDDEDPEIVPVEDHEGPETVPVEGLDAGNMEI